MSELASGSDLQPIKAGMDADKLRAAGFNDKEISDYATKQRERLRAAGFKDQEIDSYFSGGPVVHTDKVSDGLTSRVGEGEDFVSKMLSKPYSERLKEWSAQKYKEGNYPGFVLGGAATMIAGIPDIIVEGLDATKKAIKGTLTPDEELSTAANLAMFLGLGGYMNDKIPLVSKSADGKFSRIVKGQDGQFQSQSIGGVPKSEDFANATKAAAGDNAPKYVQDKILKSYDENGVHPAEAAHDAANDPVVKQELLSSDKGVSPYVKESRALPGDYGELPTLPEPKPSESSLFQFLRRRGGLAPDADLKSVFGGNKLDIIRNTGMSLDRAREAAVEAGYLQENTPGSSTVRDFLDLIDAENRGQKIYPAGHENPETAKLAAERARLETDLTAELQGLGEDYGKVPKQVRDRALYLMYNEGKDAFGAYEQAVMEAEYYAQRAGAHPQGPKPVPMESRGSSSAGGTNQESGQPRGAGGSTRNAGSNEATDINGQVRGPQEKLKLGIGGKPPSDIPPEAPPTPYSPQDAQKIILNKIGIGGKEPGKKLTLDRLYTQAVDDLHPLKGVSNDAYTVARLTRGQFGKAQMFLEHGTFDFKTYKTTGPGLREILAPVKDDLNGLRAYLAAKRALEIDASGRTSGMDTFAAREVVNNGDIKFSETAKQLYSYQSELLRYLKDSGVLSEESFKAMQEANKDYVPFYRIMTEDAGGVIPKGRGKGFGPGNPIKALKGSERAIVDPLESIIKNTYAYMSIAERNDVGIKLVETLQKQGYGSGSLFDEATGMRPEIAQVKEYLKSQGIEEPPDQLVNLMRDLSAKEDGNTISAFKNGVRESVKINDPDLVRAFRNMDSHSAGMLIKVLKTPASLLRAGATMTPDFITKNVIRDFQTAFVNTGGAIFSPLDTAKGLKGVITKDVDFQNWLKSGGANSTLVALDRRYLQESLDKLTDVGMHRGWNVVTSPLRALRMMSELVENSTRLGEFKKVIGDQPLTKEAIQAAGYSSREVTLDFARIGASMRAYNMITAFANANIQGIDRLARAFKDKPLETTAKVAGGITLPSVLLWFANHSDPETAKRYNEIPRWERDIFYIIMTKDHIYRIPKDFTTGVIFGSGAERVLDAYFAQRPEAYNDFVNSMVSALSPNFLPTALTPLVEQFANRSTFFDRTLVPDQLEKQLPEYQFTPYTTELAKTLGKFVAAFPGMRDASIDNAPVVSPVARALTSPILIENYIRSWSGGMGTYMLQAADASLRKTGVLPDPPKPSDTLADVPFIKAFVVRYPTNSAQSIQDFYDDYNKNKIYYDTWLAQAKDGNAKAVQDIAQAGGMRMFVQLDGIKKVLSEHSQLIRQIYKNPTMKPEEKRQLIDGLYYKMIEMAQSGRKLQQQVNDNIAKQQIPRFSPPPTFAPPPQTRAPIEGPRIQ